MKKKLNKIEIKGKQGKQGRQNQLVFSNFLLDEKGLQTCEDLVNKDIKKELRLEDFEIINQLGHGNFGAVFLAKSHLGDQKYAIKKIFVNQND